MAHKRVHIIVSGLVQGVFFRKNTEITAHKLGLFGKVQNLPDGNVEILAEGEHKNLQKLVEWCHKGPPRARVDKIETKWLEPQNDFTSFQKVH
ncbi:MAG: acylphosphatase [Deltaproteobacteria bacterium]|nr:acylphosphatase [Deltaproteobacteria bacterium]